MQHRSQERQTSDMRGRFFVRNITKKIGFEINSWKTDILEKMDLEIYVQQNLINHIEEQG